MEVLHYAHGMRCGDLMDRGNNKINAFLYFLSFNIKQILFVLLKDHLKLKEMRFSIQLPINSVSTAT